MKRWLTLILLVLVSLAFVVVPVVLIQPFRPQTARALEVGYWLRRLAPWATLVAALLFVALAASACRGSRRWWAKALLVVLLLPVAASVSLRRPNIFESMFYPLAGASHARAGA